MCISFFFFFFFCLLSSVFSLLSPLFFFSFLFLSALLSLSLCSALSPSVSSQQLGGGCGLSTAQWRWLWVVNGSVEVVVGWWLFGDGLVVVSGSVGDGGSQR